MARKVIILLSLCLILLSGGAFAQEAESKKDGILPPDFEYVRLAPLMLPVITDQGLTQQVSLAITLELTYGKKDKISAYAPRLVDAYLRDLFGAVGAGHVMMRGNVLDIDALKGRLTAVTERVLGEEKKEVHEVLLQAVNQAPLVRG